MNVAGRVLSQATASPGRRQRSAASWHTVSRPASVISTTTNSPSVPAICRRERRPEHGLHVQSTSARSSTRVRRAVARNSRGGGATDQGRCVAESIRSHASALSGSAGEIENSSWSCGTGPSPSDRAVASSRVSLGPPGHPSPGSDAPAGAQAWMSDGCVASGVTCMVM